VDESQAHKAALAGLTQFENALRLQREADAELHSGFLQTARAQISLAKNPEDSSRALDSVVARMPVVMSW